ncbi:MAG: N-6 DNA methylase [Candidatus Omnitrophica bacterium]|nr:N-6 DNA methylase [Candidatus Omnitrophota bacterium]
MEEVFANSNFTNNVKGGVIAEVIGLVNEIDELRILKTDLLGDAIESALSETGGTKDLGLFRTPDHIRQMMVEMVDPDFTDAIFDPACGTAGFLFDAYEYVIEKSKNTRKFPPEHIANQFYRVGIGGIEYQGRIRKMAAVNLYIRGLNPHNIDQGDSLKMYDPLTDGGSKSIVIANPPFGAERDQPAYPNVWEEYPKESETTILFVKLMFDLLKKNGRCAVVVSEGFLTWRQNSACALRKILLNEANLRAVISMPQGVFVSKSGQGAKTSILYFEKGHPTDFVWYYRIENDGFSMGTNRKPIEGSQIPELLELFKEVKQSKKPQDTIYSFCIAKEQIETLDPRIAERIQKEVSEKTKERNAKKRLKLLEGLNKKLESKKINKELHDEKLWQFDNVVESQIENEITKAIEKTHNYHFNLQNYRSSLSVEQTQEWKAALKRVKICNDSKINKRYQELQKANPKDALSIIASFDSQDALQMDITREYLSKLEEKVLKQDEKLAKLFEILKETKVFSFEPLSSFLIDLSEERRIELEEDKIYCDPTISTKTNTISVSNEALGADLKVKKRILIKPGDLVIGKMHTQNGSFAIADKEYVSTGTFVPLQIDETKIDSKYLFISLSPAFDKLGIEDATGRETYKTDEILALQIPLPPREVQNEIVEKIEKQKQIIDGAEKIRQGFSVDQFIDNKHQEEIVEKLAQVDGSPIKDLGAMLSERYVGGENIESGTGRLLNLHTVREAGIIGPSYIFKKGHVLYSKVRPNLQKCFYADFDGVCSSDIYPLKVCNEFILPQYFALVLQSKLFAKKTETFQEGRSGMPKINQDQLAQIKIPLPRLEIQRQIVEKFDRQMQALEGVRLLKAEAENRIENILYRVWSSK